MRDVTATLYSCATGMFVHVDGSCTSYRCPPEKRSSKTHTAVTCHGHGPAAGWASPFAEKKKILADLWVSASTEKGASGSEREVRRGAPTMGGRGAKKGGAGSREYIPIGTLVSDTSERPSLFLAIS